MNRSIDSSRDRQQSGPSVPATLAWLWPLPPMSEGHIYVEWVQDFELPPGSCPDQAILWLAACGPYMAWLNNDPIGCGPCRDYPQPRPLDEWDVSRLLREGMNRLSLRLEVNADGHFSHLPGSPGVGFELAAGAWRMGPDDGLRWRLSPAYITGSTACRINFQMGYTFEFDAGEDGTWRQQADVLAAGDGWQALPADSSELAMPVRARPLPPLDCLSPAPVTVRAQGDFMLNDSQPVTAPLADQLQEAWLGARFALEFFTGLGEQTVTSPLALPLPLAPQGEGLTLGTPRPGATGSYVLVDLGQEDTGFITFELTAEVGTTVDVAWGEHVDDLRVRSAVGGRHFAARYRCRSGRQAFTHWHSRIAGRYLQLFFHGSAPTVLHYAGIIPTRQPVPPAAPYASPDGLDTAIRDTALHTLRLCMQGHFEDCPWREQALYANDGRNQALASYYAFGDYRFVQHCLTLLGRGLKPDGWFEMCAPAEIPITIPSFSFAWVFALADHWLYNGDPAFMGDMFPILRRFLDGVIDRCRPDGLLPCPTGARFWQFYDWTPGMDGVAPGDCTRFESMERERFDALLNAQYGLALTVAAEIASGLGEPEVAAGWLGACDRLRGVFHDTFWDDTACTYRTHAGGIAAVTCELPQAVAILAGLCPADFEAALLERLASADNGLVPTTLSQSLYKYKALLRHPGLHGVSVAQAIAGDWGSMLLAGATSFWETKSGAWDFGAAGSLCHGWSSLPLWFQGAWRLGIRPLGPGFSSFSVAPCVTPLPGLSGEIPTPKGAICIEWLSTGGDGSLKARLRHPAGLCPVPAPGVLLDITGYEPDANP